MPRRRIEWAFTDRHTRPLHRCGVDTPRIGGGRYAEFNLGDHVGDDPAAVAANRSALATLLRPGRAPVAFMQQVHGATVAVLDEHPGVPVEAVDALVTTRSDLPLAVLVADCAPVIVHAVDGAVAAVVHAGRSGLPAGIVGSVVDAIAALGVSSERLVARVGPSIGGCCYEVPADLQQEVCAVVPQARATTRRGTPALDLRTGVVAQLLAAGVRDISIDGRCTYESAELYSYRRDGVTGRFAGIVAISS